MATKGRTNPEKIARWKVITTGLKPLLGDMPHLADFHGQLEKIITQSEELDARSEALKAESREVNKTRATLAKSGDDLRKRLAASLKTSYGFDSEKLIEFGVQPTRPRTRDKKPRVQRTPANPEPAPQAKPETPTS
jgi:hypothetical protein